MCERENIISPPSLSHMPWFGNNGCYFLVVSALPHRITAWSVADRDFKQNHHDIITWRNDFLRDAIPLLLKRPGWQLSPQTAQLHRLVRMRHLMPDRCQRSHTSCRLYERWECLCVKPWVNRKHTLQTSSMITQIERPWHLDDITIVHVQKRGCFCLLCAYV